ncbi:hypothetical protein [Vibrio phage vB_VpaP_SJSY21]|nr:hypothetical protein [Vibrio phage vB_VpaP_SJSY21]
MKTVYTNATANDKIVYYKINGDVRERKVSAKGNIRVHPDVDFKFVKSVTIGE